MKLISKENPAAIQKVQAGSEIPDIRDWLGIRRVLQKNESILHSLRRKREQCPKTLEWPQRMKEFYDWQKVAESGKQSPNILWITGKAGVGKSMVAAVLVDILQSDSAVSVAYAFCQQGQTLSEIVRILAYQCAINDNGVREQLQRSYKDYPRLIEENAEFSQLLDNLLVEPVKNACGQPLYVVLDGVDKVDESGEAVDELTPAFGDFFEPLRTLPSVNILVLCRPHATRPDPTLERSIGYEENCEDIKTYVNIQMKNLKRDWFDDMDPLDFFPKRSQGVFLWVDSVFRQLRNARYSKPFKDILVKATQGDPGNLKKTFCDILSHIQPEDKAWVKKSLTCVSLANGILTTGMLETLARKLLDDEEAADFGEFLTRTCGSIFDVVHDIQYAEPQVQLIHESFQLFILDAGVVSPKEFAINEKSGHSELVLACLQLLLSNEASATAIQYAAANWTYHLRYAGSTTLDGKILVCLRDLSSSPQALEEWVLQSFVREPHPQGLETTVDEKPLATIQSWLQSSVSSGPFVRAVRRISDASLHEFTRASSPGERRTWVLRLRRIVRGVRNRIDMKSVKHAEASQSDMDESIHEALDWRSRVLDSSNFWADHIGKTCGRIWMSKTLDEPHVCNAFSLSWKHFTQVMESKVQDEHLIDESVQTLFRNMAEWISEPNIALNQHNMAIGLRLLGRLDDSLRLFEKLLLVEPHNVNILSEIGSIHLRKTQYPFAIKAFTKALDLKPSYHEIRYKLANVLLLIDDREKAIKVLQEADPPTSSLLQGLGDAYRANAQLKNAIDAYNQCLDIDSHNIWAYGGLSALYQGQGENQESIMVASRGLSSNRTNAWALAIAGDAYKAASDYPKAIRYYEEAISRKPDCREAWNGLGDLYFLMGKPEEAVTLFRKGLEMDSIKESWWILPALGDALRMAGKGREALAVYENVDQKNLWGLLCLADAYGANKMSEEALHTYRLCLDGGMKTGAWPYKGCAALLEELARYPEAVECYRDAIAALPNDYSFQISLGQLHTRIGAAQNSRGSFKEAQKCFSRAMEQCPIGNGRLLFAFLNLPDTHFGIYDNPESHIDESILAGFFWKLFAEALVIDGLNESVAIYDKVISKYELVTEGKDKNDLLWCYSDYLGTLGLDVFEMKRSLPMEIVWIGLGVACASKGDTKAATKWYQKAAAKLPDNLWLEGVVTGYLLEGSVLGDDGSS